MNNNDEIKKRLAEIAKEKKYIKVANKKIKEKSETLKGKIKQAETAYLKKYANIPGAKSRFKRSDEYKKITSRPEKEIQKQKEKVKEKASEIKEKTKEVKLLKKDSDIIGGIIYDGDLFGILRGGGANAIYKLIKRVAQNKIFTSVWSELDADNGDITEKTLTSFKGFLSEIGKLSKRAFDKSSYIIFTSSAVIGYESSANKFTLSFAVELTEEQ